MAISAQKALVGKIRGDQDLLKRSGIQALEVMLAQGDHPVPGKNHAGFGDSGSGTAC
jgi:hypothetical protein